MSKRSATHDPTKWNPSQIVAHNMTKARLLRGHTQAEVAERMSLNTDTKWTKTSVALAEGSVGGSRIRAFTAVELVALARTFNLPVTYFLAPPEDGKSHALDLPDVPPDAWQYFMMLIVGHEDNVEFVGRQYANYVTSRSVEVPRADADFYELDEFTTDAGSQIPLDPSDVLAAAFHGLMLTHTRGAPPAAGDTLDMWISVLDNLQFALQAFQGYKPGRFINPQMAQEIARRREQMLDIDRDAKDDEMRLMRFEGEAREKARRAAEGGENEQEDK